jgi:hypothetical protein
MHELELSGNPLRAASKELANYLSARDASQPLSLGLFFGVL